jgi:uncharacterized protein involved in cysteine biosynthesis
VGFFRGLLAPFRGALFVLQQRLWKYLVIPILLNLALGIGAMWGAATWIRREPMLVNEPVLRWLLVAVVTVLGGIAIFIAVQPILTAVFTDRLSEVVEKRVRGGAPNAPFFASAGRALVHGLLKLVLYAIAIVTAALLTAFVGPIGTLVGVGLGAIFLAYDGFDYALSRRGRSFAGKWGYLARHPGLTLGYGLGATALYLVPLAIFVAPSFAAAGATLAFLDAEPKQEPNEAPKGDTSIDTKTDTKKAESVSPKTQTI